MKKKRIELNGTEGVTIKMFERMGRKSLKQGQDTFQTFNSVKMMSLSVQMCSQFKVIAS